MKVEANGKPRSFPGAAVVSLSRWLEQVGVTTCTAWRWRKKGWLKTINIAGRQYLTQEAIDEFHLPRSCDLIETLADVMLVSGIPEHIRSDNGPEFVAGELRKWLAGVGAQTLYIEPGNPWENG